MVALLVFIMATLEFLAANKMLDGRGPFGGNVLKNPARCTSAMAFRIVCTKMVARVPHYDEKRFKLQDNKARKKNRKRFGGKTFVIELIFGRETFKIQQ